MKVLPYIYKCTHRKTGEFYIGSRWANKVPSSEDLGKSYFTSSKVVSSDFKNFDYEILVECFDSDFAWELEQQLIYENWDSDLIINGHYSLNKVAHFRNKGGYKLSKETRLNQSKPKSYEHRSKIANANRERFSKEWERAKLRKPKSEETKIRMSAAQRGKVVSDEQKRNISRTNKEKGISPKRIECSCVICKRVFGINIIKRHYDTKHIG